MSQVGFQDYWVTGSRLYFQRDPVNGVEQPVADLGTINVANPQVSVEQVSLFDPDGGIRSIIDQGVTQIDEVYDITCSNLNLENFSLLFLADPPAAFSQAAGAKTNFLQYCWPARMRWLKDPTTLLNLYNWESIFGVTIPGDRIVTDVGIVTAYNPNTGTFTTSASLVGKVLPNDFIIVHRAGLLVPGNARTYTVKTVAAGNFTVFEPGIAAESGVTVSVTYKSNTVGTTGAVLPQKALAAEGGRTWEVASLSRGLIRFFSAGLLFNPGTHPSGASLGVWGHLAATANAKRLFSPQTSKGVIQGNAILVWSRSNNTIQTAREFRCAVTPNGSALNDEDFSNLTLQFKVLNDVTAQVPAGRVLQFIGATPPES